MEEKWTDINEDYEISDGGLIRRKTPSKRYPNGYYVLLASNGEYHITLEDGKKKTLSLSKLMSYYWGIARKTTKLVIDDVRAEAIKRNKAEDESLSYICIKCGKNFRANPNRMADFDSDNPVCSKCVSYHRDNNTPGTILTLHDPFPSLYVPGGMDEVCNALRVGI